MHYPQKRRSVQIQARGYNIECVLCICTDEQEGLLHMQLAISLATLPLISIYYRYQLLRHYAGRWKVTGSSPDEGNYFFL
jgi:hypothetical protein